jgi:Acyl-CoA synthetases (AMP-forming)/AMP-acid ligases II
VEGSGKTGFIDDFIKSDDPDSTCLIDQGKIFSYAEIDNLVSRLSSFISDRIRSREARVAIFLPNSWEFFVVLYATIRAGGIAVPIDFRSSTTEVAEILMKTSPELSFVFDGKSHFFDGFNGLRIIVNTSFREWIESINPVKKKISREESDPA